MLDKFPDKRAAEPTQVRNGPDVGHAASEPKAEVIQQQLP